MYSLRFSSMICLTAVSTSGDVPRNLRCGILMVLPTFISAIAFQKSASEDSWLFFLFCRREPSFRRPKEPVAE